VDEAFIELSDPAQSVADIAASSDFVIVLRSLTKTFAIPGLRIGFAVASTRFADILNNVRLHWNLNSVALGIGKKFLKNNRTYLEKSLSLIKKEREWLFAKLGAIRGFRPYPSDTNFILVDIGEFFLSSAEFISRILKKGIIIRDCASFGLENHIRVAVKKRRENRRMIRAISIIISEWGNELARKEIGEALERGKTARSRLNCEYYPCHFEGQDCTFCFCPFYPCNDERTGGKQIQRTTGGSVWSCAGCRLIHRGDIGEKTLKELMKGNKIKEVWNTLIEPELE
jgi:Zn-finger protein